MERDARHVLSELLVLRAQGGDEVAFGELHALWRADFLRYATSRVGYADAAEEVAQTAWIAIARGLPRIDDPACFVRWALRIVERRAADFVRRRQRERQGEIALQANAEEESLPREPSDEAVQLRECIARMASAARDVLELFYTTGLSVGEIAAVLGIPEGTVKSRLFHAREELKRQFERSLT